MKKSNLSKDELHRDAERQALLDIMQGLITTKDLQDFLRIVHNSIAKVIYAENFFVTLYNKDTALFEEIYSVDKFDLPGTPSRLEKSTSAYVFRSGQPFLSTQARFDELAARGEVELVGTNSPSWLGVPLKTSSETIGVMVVQDYDTPNRYSEHDMDFLASIAGQVALVIEHKRAEDQLRYQASLLTNMTDAIIATDNQYHIKFWNSAAESQYGWSAAEVSGRPFGDFIQNEFLNKTREEMIETLTQHRFWKGEVTQNRRDGTRFPVHSTVSLVMDDMGQPIGVIAINRDITERKQAEEALRTSQAFNQAILDNSPIGISVRSKTGQLLSANDAWKRIWAIPESDFLEDSTRERQSLSFDARDNYLKPHQDDVRRVYEQGGSFYLPELKTSNARPGAAEWISQHFYAIQDAQGNVERVIILTENITERKQTEDALRKSDSHAQAMLQAIPDLVFRLDREGVFLDYKADISDLYAQSEPTIIGKRNRDITPPEFADLIDLQIRATLATGILQIFEYHLPVPNRGTRYYEARMVPSGTDEVTAIVRDITERKQAEEARRKSEQNLLAILNATHDSACLVDPEGRYIFLNESLAKGLGRSVSELVGTLSTESVPKAVAETRLTYLKQVVQSGKPLEFDNSRDGRHFSIRYWPVLDVQGRTEAIAVFASDITERKRTEEMLREREQTWATLISNLPGFVFRCANDHDWTMEYISEGCRDITGYAPDDFLQNRTLVYNDIVRADHQEPLWQKWQEALSRREAFEEEYPILTASGEARWVWERGRGVYAQDGRLLYLEGFITDITARKQADEALRASEEKFRRAFTISPDSININRLQDGMYVAINNGFTQIMGYTPEECIGKTSVELNIWDRPEDRQALVEGLTKCGEVVNLEARFRAKNGDIKYGLMSAAVLELDGVKHIISITRDITERKRAEDLLVQTHQNYENFFNTIDEFLFVLDEQGNIIHTNTTVIDRLGYTREELFGKSVLMLHPPERRAEAGRIVSEMLSGVTEFCPVPVITKLGVQIPVETRVSRGLWDGKPVVFGVTKDISKLQLSEEKFSKLFHINPSACGLSDLVTRKYVEVNETFYTLLGFNKDEVVGKTASDLGILNKEAIDAIALKMDSNGSVINATADLKTKNGDIKHVLLSAENINVQDKKYRYTVVHDITERVQAQEALHENEEKMHSIFRVAPTGIGVVSNRVLLEVNPRICEMTGYTKDELIGQSARILYPTQEDFEFVGKEKYQQIAQMGSGAVETRWQKKDGSIIDILLASTPIDPADLSKGVTFTALDITARKQAEQKLQESEARYRFISENTADVIWALSLQTGKFTFVSDSVQKLRGYTSEEVMNQTMADALTPESLQAATLALQQGITKRKPGDTNLYKSISQVDQPCKDGSVVSTEVSISLIFNEQGQPIEIIGVTRDITERKQAEERLRQSEERYRVLFNHLPIPAFTKDINGAYTSCNEENLKYWAANPIGHTDAEISPNKTASMLHANDQRVIESGETIVADELLKNTPLGDRLFVSHKVPLRDGSGNIIGVLGASLDITERKRIEDEMLEKSKELEALFTISSHLRTAQTADDMLPVVLAQMSKVLKADANAVIFLDPDQTRFTFTVCDGLLTFSAGLQFDVENSVSGHVMQTRQPYVTLDYANDPLKSGMVLDSAGIGAMVVVPLQSETEFIGTLLCGRAKDSPTGPFTSAEVQLLTSIGEMVGNALRRARLYDDALSRLQRVQGLRSIDAFINANMDVKLTLKLLVSQAISLMKVDAAAILLYNPDLHTLEYISAQGFHYRNIEKTRFELSNTFSERAVMEHRITTTSDPLDIQDPVHKEIMQKEGFITCHITPMIAKGKVLGVLELYKRTHIHSDQEWVEFLESLGAQAAIAIDSARLFRDLQTSNLELALAYDATIQGWSQALDLKDRETEGHTIRVTETTVGIARLAGLSEKEITHIRRGALLHDIGKMGIPDRILNKTGKLTPKEWGLMRQHPQFAYDMLHSIEFLRPALDIPYYHHERWDGTGYPHGLQNLQIPYAARLFAVVDVWDALSSDRSYRKAWPKKKVFAYIQKQTGKHFDPQVVELFLKYMETRVAA